MFADPVSLIVFLLVVLLVAGVIMGRIDFMQAILAVIFLVVLFAIFGPAFHR